MTREEANDILPILQAFAEGKAIESRCIKGEKSLWYDDDDLSFDDDLEYRVKPEQEPKYRPFKNAEECWQEMQKHQPVGWVKNKRNDKDPEVFIHCGVIKGDWILTGVDEEPFPFDKIYNNYTFADGTPFGVKVEE